MNPVSACKTLFPLPAGGLRGWLQLRPRCGHCAVPLLRFGQVRRGMFVSPRAAARYLHAREWQIDFSALCNGEGALTAAARQQSVLIEAELYCCQSCARQQLIDRVKVFHERRGWKEVKALGLRREVPAEQDLRPQFD